ncbi:MAG: alpha-N-arabinofuranosidase [Anaerolineae bacterium]|nr:alpha-N-arabinofuranosidase [Anaerolineae bacterium]MCB0224211.1 alpha-N-arabinofuranosidase [Anaerolineae bacterium]
MKDTTITLHTAFKVGQVDPRIFGGFLEHMGRAVYEGVYDPDCIHADEDGFRTDVLTALEPLQYTVMRYPGGNFASGYHWLNGIGPRNQRPTMQDLAWQSKEPNQIGTDEYIQLCRRMNWTPMLTVNLGTGTPEEARNWVEYCNSSTGTYYADMRAANGSEPPHGVKLWCLGNEMDGPWQLGHVPADQYAIRAQQAAKMMKDTDPSLELVACGSCAVDLPTYMEWDRHVLEYLGDLADYISLHRYVGNPADDTPDYLAVTNSIDQQIEEMDAVCRYVQGKNRSRKRAYLCFDEWNVWYRARQPEHMDGKGKFAPHLIEEVYNLEDALVVAGFLNSFIRHADVLKIANLAQIVNVIAPILTQGDAMLLQSIYYPLAMYTKRRSGISLQPVVQGPTYEGQTNGQVTYIDTSAILNGDQLHVFTTNRNLEDAMTVRINLADRPIVALADAELLTGPDPKAANSYEQPHLIKAQPFQAAEINDGAAIVTLPPLSVAALTFRLVH